MDTQYTTACKLVRFLVHSRGIPAVTYMLALPLCVLLGNWKITCVSQRNRGANNYHYNFSCTVGCLPVRECVVCA